MSKTVSFSTDIKPVLVQYQAPMIWRFDLGDYENVKRNASIIQQRISGVGGIMPPPPFQPLGEDFIKLFGVWVEQGCPP